jgi:hypothetical protein
MRKFVAMIALWASVLLWLDPVELVVYQHLQRGLASLVVRR